MSALVSDLSDLYDTADPRLEVISCLPRSGTARNTPILFIHGAYVAAWCWREYFLPYFAEHGYAAYAVSLCGHGKSGGRERLAWISLREYVADVETVIGRLGKTPILVGHSMGGMVIQKYLERRTAPAAVLMASPPPEGLLATSMWLALTKPLLTCELNLMALGGFVTLAGARRAIFSADVPDWKVARFLPRSQPDSHRAVLDMHWLDLPKPNPKIKPPALVLGAENDALIPVPVVKSTARAFGTRAQIVPDTAHAMMLDTRWQAVAERILAWLDEQAF